MVNTDLIFLQDTFQFETTATVTGEGKDDEGSYVVTSATVFYPGGGGQEPDKGFILTEGGIRHPITKAKLIRGKVYHYLTDTMQEGTSVSIHIDPEHRLQNAKLHTGGHLLASVVYEKLKWPLLPVKGFHYQQGSYMEFEPLEDISEIAQQELETALREDIQNHLPVTKTLVSINDPLFEEAFKPDGFIPPVDKPLRLVKINHYLAYPCGGTHLHHTGELNLLKIRHVKNKKGNVRISYEAG